MSDTKGRSKETKQLDCGDSKGVFKQAVEEAKTVIALLIVGAAVVISGKVKNQQSRGRQRESTILISMPVNLGI